MVFMSIEHRLGCLWGHPRVMVSDANNCISTDVEARRNLYVIFFGVIFRIFHLVEPLVDGKSTLSHQFLCACCLPCLSTLCLLPLCLIASLVLLWRTRYSWKERRMEKSALWRFNALRPVRHGERGVCPHQSTMPWYCCDHILSECMETSLWMRNN